MHVLHFFFETMTLVYCHRDGDNLTTYIATENAVMRERVIQLSTGATIREDVIAFDPEKPELSLTPLQVWLVRGFRGIPKELQGNGTFRG